MGGYVGEGSEAKPVFRCKEDRRKNGWEKGCKVSEGKGDEPLMFEESSLLTALRE